MLQVIEPLNRESELLGRGHRFDGFHVFHETKQRS